MTKKEAVASFREVVLPIVVKTYGKNDKVAISEAWNDWTDVLCKNGEISSRQYETWTGPF